MTERLYYHDASLIEFNATVVARAGDPRRVILDRTAFYPTSGGQPHDTGMLGGVRVVDVVEGDDGAIVHVVDAPLPEGPVRGTIDAARRRDHMEQHTAQHLLSAIASDSMGWETASVHFGLDHSTIEFATPSASAAQLAALESQANAAVAAARPVRVSFEEASVAIAAGLRKAPPRAGTIRVITIETFDRSACGGTHVANTTGIGPVLCTGVERIRGQVRIGFLAGGRVFARLRGRDVLVEALAARLSCGIDELLELVPKRQDELKAARERLETLERELGELRVRALVGAAVPDPDGVRRIIHYGTTASSAELRAMAQAANATARTVFIGTLDHPPSVVVGASADSGADAGALLKSALAAVGGKGGGSPRLAQGTVPDRAALSAVVAALGAAR